MADKECDVLGSDSRLRIYRFGAIFYYYPDVTVDCSGSKDDEISKPTVIFEVRAPATDRADHGDKLVNYQFLPSMKVYVLVDQFHFAVTIYRRGEDNLWSREFLNDPANEVALPEIGCSLPLSAIYHRVF